MTGTGRDFLLFAGTHLRAVGAAGIIGGIAPQHVLALLHGGAGTAWREGAEIGGIALPCPVNRGGIVPSAVSLVPRHGGAQVGEDLLGTVLVDVHAAGLQGVGYGAHRRDVGDKLDTARARGRDVGPVGNLRPHCDALLRDGDVEQVVHAGLGFADGAPFTVGKDLVVQPYLVGIALHVGQRSPQLVVAQRGVGHEDSLEGGDTAVGALVHGDIAALIVAAHGGRRSLEGALGVDVVQRDGGGCERRLAEGLVGCNDDGRLTHGMGVGNDQTLAVGVLTA